METPDGKDMAPALTPLSRMSGDDAPGYTRRQVLQYAAAAIAISPLPGNGLLTKSLGTLDGFYRSTQVQGNIFGQDLFAVPAYLLATDIDLSYQPQQRPGIEIPFVDTFSIVRFMGGFREDVLQKFKEWDPSLGRRSLDYVVKGPDGNLVARATLVQRHLAAYLEAGYRLSDITIVLDNVPWDIARDGGAEGVWGQKNPPASMPDWQWTIEHLLGDLRNLYPTERPAGFKIGTEYDEKASFDGTADEFFSLYRTAFMPIRAALPDTQIVPGEFTGGGECAQSRDCVYDTPGFLTRARGAKIPPSYVPRSLHGILSVGHSGAYMPSAVVERAVKSYALCGDVIPEIHQFGLLGQPFGLDFGNDTSVRQASWEFQTLMGLRRALRPRRVFHWETFFHIERDGMSLINGSGVVRLLLDRYRGAEMVEIRSATTTGDKRETLAMAFVRGPRIALVVASFSAPAETADMPLSLDVSSIGKLPVPPEIRYTRLVPSTCVFAAIRRDLADAENLRPEFMARPDCIADPNRMAAVPARALTMLRDHRARYENTIKAVLRLKPVTDLSGFRVQGAVMTAVLEPCELLVLEWRRPT